MADPQQHLNARPLPPTLSIKPLRKRFPIHATIQRLSRLRNLRRVFRRPFACATALNYLSLPKAQQLRQVLLAALEHTVERAIGVRHASH